MRVRLSGVGNFRSSPFNPFIIIIGPTPPLQVALKAGVRAFWLDPRRPDDVIDHLLQITAAPALALALASR